MYITTLPLVLPFLSVWNTTYYGKGISASAISGFKCVSVSAMLRALLHASKSSRKGILVLLLGCNSPLIFSLSIGMIPMLKLLVTILDVLAAEAILGVYLW